MSNKRILTEFIEISNKIHNNKYDYSKSIYKNSKTKLIITRQLLIKRNKS